MQKASCDLPYWLALWRAQGIGPQRFQQLLANTSNLSEYFDDRRPSKALRQMFPFLNEEAFDWGGVEQDLVWAEQPNHAILTFQDARYPLRLKQISAPPPVLFVKGNPLALQSPQLAMVGSRNATPLGKELAFAFAKDLALNGLSITSGLALGIDTAAHQGALMGRGITIGVLGHGLDIIYPANNKQLAANMLTEGALVSEFPIGASPQRQNFPRRNRLISGLSLGVLVIEASLKSGSLITANYALEQGREIFALPGSLHNPLAKGCHALIKEGAKLVEKAEDIFEELKMLVTVTGEAV